MRPSTFWNAEHETSIYKHAWSLVYVVQVVGPGKPGKDFVIQGPHDHGVEGVVNLYGIESPGLTSSLSIGELVMQMLLHNMQAPSSVSGGEQRD